MKTKTYSVLSVCRAVCLGVILILPLLSCNFFGIPDYKLAVTVKDGVQGTPENGEHSYQDLAVIDYKYSPLNPLHTVEVIYEDNRLAAVGKIVMYTNVTLEARLIDIRGIWKIKFSYSDTAIDSIEFTITFSGNDILAGTFSDDRGYRGTWDASKGNITFKYTNWKDYVLTGPIFSEYFGMSGTWKGESKNGTWVSVRK